MSDKRGIILSGTQVAQEIRENLRKQVGELKEKSQGLSPGLAIVQVGGREDSNVYIRMKMKAAEEIGIEAHHVKLPKDTTEAELLNRLNDLNNDINIHGIIVQMPLDSDTTIDSHLITDSVSPDKDVDGLNTINEGRVAIGDQSGFLPCTPNGCIELIKRTGVSMVGAEAVVLGRSKIVGTPAAELLKWENATVTICHSRTKDLKTKCQRADILVVGIGQPELVKGDWIKPGAVVIDCGINAIPDSSKKSGQRLVGDVAFEEACKVASYITPVPGGVGPMTVAMLMRNTVIGFEKQVKRLAHFQWNIRPLPLRIKDPVPSDIEIARSQVPKEIFSVAQEIGLLPPEVISYGSKKAKISLGVVKRLQQHKNGKYVVCVGVTPTPLGEGKSTMVLGLAQALTVIKKKNCIATLRQPSQGPTFGIKGGAAGGGYSQVIPMEDFNLHLTGDIHAVSAAHNLLAAQLDARMFHEATQTDSALFDRLVKRVQGIKTFSPIQLRRLERLGIRKTDPDMLTDDEKKRFARLDIDPKTIQWNRVVDVNDRYLRKITTGQSPTEKGITRESSFMITVASEIMAILALATSMSDLKDRLSKIVVAFDKSGNVVTADDLGMTGALLVLMKDALLPNLMQTLEGSAVLVHAGPFANIAHGCSSILADKIALKLVSEDGYVVTEAGFGSDIGMEKFMDIKCRASGDIPNCIVLVTTIRALKMHGGGPSVTPGSPLPEAYIRQDLALVEKGMENLIQHISNGKKFGLPVIVCINKHPNDTEAEIAQVRELSIKHGAFDAVLCTSWATGSVGSADLASAVIKACEKPHRFKLLYELDLPLIDKMKTIAREMYGAKDIKLSPKAEATLQIYTKKGFGKLPVCMAKTSLSFTGDANVKGAPKDFVLEISDVSISVGAGFVIAICGEIPRMPGLPTRPAIYDIDLDLESGEILGLF